MKLICSATAVCLCACAASAQSEWHRYEFTPLNPNFGVTGWVEFFHPSATPESPYSYTQVGSLPDYGYHYSFIFPGNGGPIDITGGSFFNFSFTTDGAGLIAGGFSQGTTGNGLWLHFGPGPGQDSVAYRYQELDIAGNFVAVPTPGAAGALAMGGLAVVRRRRR